MSVSTAITTLENDVTSQAIEYMVNQSRLADYIRTIQVPQGVGAIKVPVGSKTVVAQALTEGQEAGITASTSAGPTITPTIHVYRDMVTDLAEFSAPGYMEYVARKAVESLIMKENQDIWALFDGFSTSLGTTNTALTLDVVRNAVKTLKNASASGPYTFVVTPTVMDQLVGLFSANTNITALMQRDSAMIDGRLTRLFGVNLVEVSSGIADDGNGDYKCGMFSKDALVMASKWLFRTRIQERASFAAWDIVCTSCYGVAEAVDAFGVEIIADGD
jgi:hypothetical protein